MVHGLILCNPGVGLGVGTDSLRQVVPDISEVEWMDHDQLFKKLIQKQTDRFIRLFFPEGAKRIDFSTMEPLDKEVYTAIPVGYRRQSDILVRVRERGQEGRFLLILVEIEDREGRTRSVGSTQVRAHPESAGNISLGERLMVYFLAVWTRYRQAVVPIVLYLFKGGDGVRAERYEQEVTGWSRFLLEYQTVGLPGLVAREYVGHEGALSAALGALMDGGGWPKWRQKGECLKAILSAKDDAETKLLAWYCVQKYLDLGGEEEARTNEWLCEEGYMEAMEMERTWIDEIRDQGREEGRQEGREEGRVKGMQEILLKLMKLKFGVPDARVEERIRGVRKSALLERLSEGVLTANTPEEVLALIPTTDEG